MKLSTYQEAVARTMNKELNHKESLSNYALGLAGEAGEVLEPLKKHLYHGKSLDLAEIKKEIGDVHWYLAALANTLNLDLDEVLQENVEKLIQRWPNGFVLGRGM